MNALSSEFAAAPVFDELVVKRAASLAAHGMSDEVISDALGVPRENVETLRADPVFKAAYAEKLAERSQGVIDRAEGWDAVEEAGISRVLQSMKGSYDPKFALMAAQVANKAQRRTPEGHRVLDATRGGRVVILSLNKTYINQRQTSESAAALELPQGEVKELPLRRSDIPTPKKFSELLGIPASARAVAQETLEADALGMWMDYDQR